MPARVSFRLRLMLAACLWIAAGLAASWVGLQAILRGHLDDEFAEELQHHGEELAGLVTVAPDGTLALRQALSDRRFFERGSGHYWQVTGADGRTLRSASLGEATLALPEAVGPRQVVDGTGPSGRLRLTVATVRPLAGTAAPVRIAVGIDRSVIDDLLARFRLALGLGLGLIAAGLLAAVLAQVTFGLWPLVRVREGLAAIRAGQADRLPEDLPAEVAPLAASLNAMIQANDEVVRRARVQAGNLAHALQTHVAVLMDEGRRLEAAGGGGAVVLREAERMRRQIEFQLAHARASASRGRPHAAAAAMPALRGLLMAMSRLHRDRDLGFALEGGPEGLAVACEAEDLDEMAGNLIDNAAKWARSRVLVTLAAGDGTASITVEDDGPGMPPAARAGVFDPGTRLDETVAGHGLGLAIVREIATLYGGRVTLEDSELGGVRARLKLPVRRA